MQETYENLTDIIEMALRDEQVRAGSDPGRELARILGIALVRHQESTDSAGAKKWPSKNLRTFNVILHSYDRLPVDSADEAAAEFALLWMHRHSGFGIQQCEDILHTHWCEFREYIWQGSGEPADPICDADFVRSDVNPLEDEDLRSWFAEQVASHFVFVMFRRDERGDGQ